MTTWPMTRRPLYLVTVLALALSACTKIMPPASTPPQATPACLIGFDVGSSGLRVGAPNHPGTARAAVDFMPDVWANGRVKDSLAPTIDALNTLPAQASLPQNCLGVAGGYSVWRLSVDQAGAAAMAAVLGDLYDRTGVALLIIPQDVEGAYGYYAARQQLGQRLTTPHILDVGGGSIQIADVDGGWGAALGQKAWRKLFCNTVKADPSPQCHTNPAGRGAMALSHQALQAYLTDARQTLGTGGAMTAVSSPVVKGLYPILRHLAAAQNIDGQVDDEGFDRTALASAITLLETKTDTQLLALLDQCQNPALCHPRFVATFITDMLLIHAFMEELQINRLEVAGADITNVPGLLADPRAIFWATHYGCYLDRLTRQGVAAFALPPGDCAP